MPAANTSNISTIQILRSYSNSAPLTLDDGQLAFSFVSNTLFIGSNTGIKVVSNPPTDVKAQEAYNQANTATVLANAAYFHANGAFIRANAAFDNSNTKLSLSGGTITGPISGPGESKLDFTTYGSNTVYLTTTNDDSTALFMGAMSAELYANTSVQIRANTKGTSQNWTFGAEGTLTFPDNTIQTTAYTPGGEIDELARATANAAYFHANGAFLKANASFNQANLTIGVDASQNVRLAFSNTRMDISDGVNASQNVRLAFSNTRMDISDGVNASQNIRLDFSNTRMAIIEGTNASQNVRLDYSNTAITIIQGVDVAQNTRLTVSEGVDLSQNVSINTQNSFITIIQGVDVGQNARMTIIEGVDVTQNTRLTVSEGVDLSQNVRLDFSNTRMTIIENTDVSQNVRLAFSNTRMDISDGVNASQNVRIDFSNAAITIIQGVDVTQNTRLTVIEGTNASQNVRLDFSNAAITIIQGVDTTQNTRLTVAEATDVSQNVRLDFSNTRMTIIEGVDTSQNSRMTIIEGVNTSQNNRMSIIEGVDVGQNTAIAATDGKMQAAYFHANGAFIRANSAFDAANLQIGVDNTQNTRMTVIEGTNVSQNARMTIIEGVDVTQNTNIANKLSLSGAASQTVTGNVVFGNDVTVTGNLVVLGNTISLNVTSFEVEDTLIQLGIGNYTTDALSIGYVGHYNDGTNAHAGFIRDALTKEFYAFQGYTPETTGNTVNINAPSFAKANIHGNWFKGNLIATTARVGGLDVNNFATAAYNQANTGTVLAQASFSLANATVGVDATQNTRLTVIEGTNASQNVRLDFSNTRMTIIDGVDATQNTAIAATDNKMQGAYNVANTADVRSVAAYFHANGAFFKANAAFDQANVTIGVDASQNSRMTVIEGTDVGQNSRMTIIENTDLSQNVRLAFSNTRMDISDGVNASQNVRLDYSNTALTIAQGVDNSQNVRLDYSNTALTIAQGVDNSQNVRLDYSNTAINQVSSAWTANTVIVANLTGYLSNSSVFFTSSNNALITTGAVIAAGDISVATGQFVSVGGPGSGTRIRRDSGLNGLDLQTSSTSRLFIADTDGSVNVRSTTSSTSNTTGALIVGGGLGVSGNVYSTGGRITINNGLATTGNSGTIFLGDSSFSKTFGSGFIFNSAISAQQFVANAGSNSAAAFTFSGVGNLGIYAPLTGVLGITANSANALFVSAPTSSVNYLQVSANTTGNAPTLTAQGSDSNIDTVISSKGTGVVNLNTGSGTQVRIIDSGGTAVNRIHLQGQATGFLPVIASRGSDTNLGMSYSTQGTGGHDFYTAGVSFTQQFKVAHTAAAVNYVQVNGNATTGAPYFSAQGTDSNISLGYTSKGIAGHIFSTGGTLTNLQFVINNTTSAVNYIQVAGNAAGQQPYFLSAGSDTNVGITYATKGTGPHFFSTGGGTLYQFEIASTASAVNYVRVTGAATGGTPTVSAQGSDSNITLLLAGKGSGGIVFDNPGYGNYFSATSAGATTTNANHIRVTGTISGVPAVIGAVGSDTNIGINITPKGNGSANITSTANSTSNTSGALVVTGGMGITGNLFMSAANNWSATTNSTAGYRLGWTDNYFYRSPVFNGVYYTGNFLSIQSGVFTVESAASVLIRTTISNDQGNNTILFAGSSPVRIQNTAASTSNTTGSLIVDGGIGVTGNVFLSSANNFSPTTSSVSYRLGWSDNYFSRNPQFSGIDFTGGYFNTNNQLITTGALSIRNIVNNDAGNNTIIFSGQSGLLIQNGASSISNTTGALIVQGGLGLSGNLSMNLASSGAGVNRINLGQSNFIDSQDFLQVRFAGVGYYYFSASSGVYIDGLLRQRAPISNDTGNNTVIFAGSSPVKIQNGTASSNTTSGALVVQGGVGISGALNATTKSFNIPHPTKEGKDLRYGSLEGPEFGVYVRGTLKGSNVIELPDYWTKLVDANTITVSLTPIGKYQKLSVKEVKDNTILINNDGWFKKEIHCYYTVFGERADVDKLDVEG